MSQNPLKDFAEDLWIADGPAIDVAGFCYPTRMAVIRLENGKLFLWSPIAFTEELRGAVSDLGDPAYIVAPNALHHLALSDWQAAFPGAGLYAAPGLGKKRPELDFAGELEQSEMPWDDEIESVTFAGSLITTEVVFFHKKSGTALFTDLLQNFSHDWVSGWRKAIAKMDRLISPSPQVPQKFRVSFINRSPARAALTTVKSWPVKHVLMAHGTPVKQDGRAFLAEAFRWLSP